MTKLYSVLLVSVVLLVAGCASDNKQQDPTAKDQIKAKWNGARAGVLYGLAKQQYEAANLDEARKTADEALRMQADSVPLHLLSARIHIELGNLDPAVTELDLVRKLEPTNSEADYLMGVIYQRWRKPEVALKWYVDASKKNATEPAYILARAEMLVAIGKGEEALSALKEGMTSFESSGPIRDAAGQVLVSLKRYAEAIPLLREAVIVTQNDPQICEHYALALYYAADYREAAAQFEKLRATERYAHRSDLALAQSECYIHLNRPRDARDLLLDASLTSPGQATVWLALAKAGIACDDFARADMALSRAMAIDNNAEASLLLGYVRMKQGRLLEALVAFRNASTMDPTDPVAVSMIGLVLQKQGKSKEALDMYGRALRLHPGDDLASMLLSSAGE